LRETLGQDWLTPNLFRIGASRLANDILMQLAKEKTDAYQSLEHFSKDSALSMFSRRGLRNWAFSAQE
jgi:deoxyribose-phosphate aldolase